MPTVLVRHPDGSETQHEVVEELRLGRHPDNDVVLTEGGVSRNHARLFLQGQELWVEDSGSSNGTFLDERRVHAPTPLHARSRLRVGDYEVRLKPLALARQLPKERVLTRAERKLPRRGEGNRLQLRGMHGPWRDQCIQVEGKLLVGRAPNSPLFLDDDSVSRRHAQLEQSAAGLMLKDLGSANGTRINGELAEESESLLLKEGDQLQFGTVEFLVEGLDGAGRPKKKRSGLVTAPQVVEGERVTPSQPHRRLLWAGGAVALLLMVGALVKVFSEAERPADAPLHGRPEQGVPLDPTVRLQEYLSECRSFASSGLGQEPDWARAEQSCEKALDLVPINDEANTLIRRIKLEKEAAQIFAQGERALERLKEEEALDAFRKIPRQSEYFGRAKPLVREASGRVAKAALADCKRYLRDAQWAAAVPRCDRYFAFACQRMSKDDLEPPMGSTLSLGSGRLKSNEWRPKDKLYLQFLTAREKLTPQAAAWTCPVSEMMAEDEWVTDPKVQVTEVFKQRFSDRSLFEAMMDYWTGRGNEAIATLQKLRIDDDRAQLHSTADALMKDVSNVDQLFKTGESALQAGEAERAAQTFHEVLELDQRLMGELALTKPSFYRRNVQQDMASHSYTLGKHWAARGDERKGCRLWKQGFLFYAGNPTLNRAVGFCSAQGLARLQGAKSCEELAAVLDYAVKGDGLEEKVQGQKAALNCP